MKTVFLNLSIRPDAKRRQKPVGLACIMTAVKRAGFDFDLINMDIDKLSMEDLKHILKSKKYDVYAMGCIVTGFKYARQAARIIRDSNPEAIIVAGNSLATSTPELILKHTEIDVAVMGEGDITIVELLQEINTNKNFSAVKGLAFLQNDQIVRTEPRPVIKDIDTIGFPDWDMFELEKYAPYEKVNTNSFNLQVYNSFPLNTARGCPFNCTFCYHVFKGERYRKYSDEKVFEEIKRLHNLHSCDFIAFWDELSFPSIKSVESFVRKMGELDFKIEWDAVTRGDLFKKEHLSLIRELKAVGCTSISYSLENANADILKAINKHLDINQFITQSQVLHKGGVTPLTSVIFGYPQETPETIRETIRVCERCNLYPSVGFLLPLPGTPIYEWAREKGFITNELDYLESIGDRQDFHINLTKMSDDELISTVRSELKTLAKKQGLDLADVMKTTTYQKPKKQLVE